MEEGKGLRQKAAVLHRSDASRHPRVLASLSAAHDVTIRRHPLLLITATNAFKGIANARTSNLSWCVAFVPRKSLYTGEYILRASTSNTCDRSAQEKSLLTEVLPSWFFLRTLATANSKSSCVTCCLRSRRAYMPGPTQYNTNWK
jgi:hypothetical protein